MSKQQAKRGWVGVVLLVLSGCGGSVQSRRDASEPAALGTTVTVSLSESPEAFANPLEGFRPSRYVSDSAFPNGEYVSTYKQYIRYSDLEATASDSVEKIKAWSNASWSTLPALNRKVIPRVVLVYPGTGEFWGDLPHDGTPNQWVTPALKTRLVAFVAKLGQAWDADPRVAAVEMGLWGNWGEHNIYPSTVEGSDRIPAEFQQALGDAFLRAFPHKKVMVRYPDTFTGYTGFGFYWDSFALPDDDGSSGGQGMRDRNLWATQMQSGEVAYDWGDQSHLGGSPNGTLGSSSNTDDVIGYIQRQHTSSLGWIAEYTPDQGVISANAARMQKAFGYRFVLRSASFPSQIASGSSFPLTFDVANVGSAPFYEKWPVTVALLDANHHPVVSSVLPGVDLRNWQPGTTTHVEATVSGGKLSGGPYTLALSIADPAGGAPGARFANTNYYAGGWTPLGRVGVGTPASDQRLGSFASLKSDTSLSYCLACAATPVPPATDGGTSTQGPQDAGTATPPPRDGGTAGSSTLVLDAFDATSSWPGTNALGQWTGANGFVNGSGVKSGGALALQFNNSGWFGSDVNRSLSAYSKLVVVVKGAKGGEENDFHVSLGGVEGSFAQLSHASITTSYRTLSIDLASNGINRTSPGQLDLSFWFGGNSTLYLSEIYFE